MRGKLESQVQAIVYTLNFLVTKMRAFTKDRREPDKQATLIFYLETVADVSIMMI